MVLTFGSECQSEEIQPSAGKRRELNYSRTTMSAKRSNEPASSGTAKRSRYAKPDATSTMSQRLGGVKSPTNLNLH